MDKESAKENSSWMVVKASALGDVIQVLDALGPFTREFKQSNISLEWIAEPVIAPLIALHPLVKMVHVAPTKKWKKEWYKSRTWQEVCASFKRLRASSYDIALDLQGNVKSSLFMSALKASKKIGFDKQSVSEWPASLGLDIQLHTSHFKRVRDVYHHGFEKAFESVKNRKPHLTAPLASSELLWSEYVISEKIQSMREYAVIALGSRWINKQPEKSTGLYLVRYLLENTRDKLYMSFGSAEERQFAQEIVQEICHPRLELLPPSSLVEYAYTVCHAKWLVGADSMPLHLAGWFSVPSFGLFGPSSDFYYGPQDSIHASWQGACPYNIHYEKRCARLRSCQTGACLRKAPDKSIQMALEKWLGQFN